MPGGKPKVGAEVVSNATGRYSSTMYTMLTVLVSLGWTFGAALIVLSLISPQIPRSWAWSEVRHSKRGVMLAGAGIFLGATGIFLGIVVGFAWEAIQAGGA